VASDDTKQIAKLLQQAEAASLADRPHDALQLCDKAALISDEGRYGAALMRGTILLDMGDPAGALSSYDSVADPQVPDARLDCARGLALFELARLAEAENALRSAVRGEPTLARAHFALGLIAELMGNGEEAEHFRRARRLEPENYPPQRRTGVEEFQKAVTDAIGSLGEGPRSVLRKMSVLVAELPNPQDLLRQQPPVSPQAPCMIVGVLEAKDDDSDELGEVEVGLLLFKRNLERMARGADDLVDNVRQALLMALDGTFKGPPLQQDEASEAGEGGSSEAAEAEAAVARREGAKLEDLRDWRRKKGLTK
jgi:tetratricopeptide (TPR) repeat protein